MRRPPVPAGSPCGAAGPCSGRRRWAAPRAGRRGGRGEELVPLLLPLTGGRAKGPAAGLMGAEVAGCAERRARCVHPAAAAGDACCWSRVGAPRAAHTQPRNDRQARFPRRRAPEEHAGGPAEVPVGVCRAGRPPPAAPGGCLPRFPRATDAPPQDLPSGPRGSRTTDVARRPSVGRRVEPRLGGGGALQREDHRQSLGVERRAVS
mmetsp:Transcript_6614/g.15913  ORF Transcript_6614/g.15913 Transcript_6614/m.15913 type:complete len:206 (+) Transcript_6614:1282-1899(+)